LTLDDLARAKGELSAVVQTRGWTTRQFAKQVRKAIPDVNERAAISKWIDANGSPSELLWGANHTKHEYRQAYIDAMHLSGDLLTAARNLQSYFDARLQEAMDAGILDHGIEDYIHRIFRKRSQYRESDKRVCSVWNPEPKPGAREKAYLPSGLGSGAPWLPGCAGLPAACHGLRGESFQSDCSTRVCEKSGWVH